MVKGQEVSLVSHKNEIINRIVVAVEKGYIYVCKREEFEIAKLQEREPVCVGFRAEDLIEAVHYTP